MNIFTSVKTLWTFLCKQGMCYNTHAKQANLLFANRLLLVGEVSPSPSKSVILVRLRTLRALLYEKLKRKKCNTMHEWWFPIFPSREALIYALEKVSVDGICKYRSLSQQWADFQPTLTEKSLYWYAVHVVFRRRNLQFSLRKRRIIAI